MFTSQVIEVPHEMDAAAVTSDPPFNGPYFNPRINAHHQNQMQDAPLPPVTLSSFLASLVSAPLVSYDRLSNRIWSFCPSSGIIYLFKNSSPPPRVPVLLSEWRRGKTLQMINIEDISLPGHCSDPMTCVTDPSSCTMPDMVVDAVDAAEDLLSSLAYIATVYSGGDSSYEVRPPYTAVELNTRRQRASLDSAASRLSYLYEEFVVDVHISCFEKLHSILCHAHHHLAEMCALPCVNYERAKVFMQIIFYSLVILKVNIRRFIESGVSALEIGVRLDDLLMCQKLNPSNEATEGGSDSSGTSTSSCDDYNDKVAPPFHFILFFSDIHILTCHISSRASLYTNCGVC